MEKHSRQENLDKIKVKMKSKFGLKTIQFNIWLYFFVFSLIIIALIWIFQLVFSQSLYTDLIERRIKRAGDTIVTNYESKNISDNYGAILAEETFNNSITALIFDTRGDIIYKSSDFFGSSPDGDNILSSKPVQEFLEKLKQSPDAKVEYRDENAAPAPRFVYGRSKETDGEGLVFFYFSSQIRPFDITASTFSQQLLITSGMLVVMSFVVSWYISGKLGKPMVSMSEAANKFAKGDYTVRFKGNNFKEVNELADTLNFAVSEISKTDSLRKELIANVSHDLRTPLTMIKAYAEMTRDLPAPKEKTDKNLNVIIEEADRLSVLVNDLLNLSRIQAGTEQFNPERCDLSRLTSDIVRRFDGFSQKQGYAIVSEIKEGLFVPADSSKLSQAIYNLIGNAINYTGANKTIYVILDRRGDKIRFSVRDTGKGIPEEDRSLIWERYYRRNMHKRSVVGNGLGLSIVKSVLTMHGADFGVESELGVGSTFWFELDEDGVKPESPAQPTKRRRKNRQNGK